jgi:chorismate dehydratase
MLRYGSVPYLNARPLLSGLADEVGPLRLEVPRVLSQLLSEGQIDVALAPVVASFDDPTLVIVPSAAVVAHGPVKSVLLFSRCPLAEVRTVGLDQSSRTSAALVRVLFEHRWGSSPRVSAPRFVSRGPGPDRRGMTEDVVLLIGDPALRAIWDGPAPLDLGSEWSAWTGLPFVFATWLARGRSAADEALPILDRAAERGRARLDDIAAVGSRRLGLPHDTVRRYLRDHLSFHFEDEERAGLQRFRELWSRTPGCHDAKASRTA